MTGHPSIDCTTVDELAAAYALGAVDRGEEAAISAHLATCPEPHDEAKSLIGAALVLPSSLELAAASPGLRSRIMTTIADTPQEHRSAPASAPRMAGQADARRTPWWRSTSWPSAIAAAGLIAAIGLGTWGFTLDRQLGERDAALRAVASADAIHAASGDAGSGWVIQSGDQAMFMAEDLADLAAGQLYEFWLIDAGGTATAVGTLTDTDGVVLVPLERDLEGAAIFAVTVETERVEQSVNDPVLVGAIDA